MSNEPRDPPYSVGESRWTLFRHGYSINTEELLCDMANMLHALMLPCSECRAFLATGEPHKMGCATGKVTP